jgi:polygalacturonase
MFPLLDSGGETFGSLILKRVNKRNLLKMGAIKSILITICLLATLTLSAKDYKASLFGVKSDGTTLNTRSIQKAVDFISENGGGRLVFYVGRYLTGTVRLKSNVTIQLEEGAILLGVSTIYDYAGLNGTKAMILADSVKNAGITGKGVIEGQGAAVFDHIQQQIQKGYLRETAAQASPALVYFQNCSGVTFDEVNLWNACGNVLSFKNCKDITIRKIAFKSAVVPGSRGIVVSDCDGVKMEGLFFDTSGEELTITGDSKNVSVMDCINKSGKKIWNKNKK